MPLSQSLYNEFKSLLANEINAIFKIRSERKSFEKYLKMSQENAIKQKLYQFVEKSSNYDVSKLTDTTLLFSEGIFDSMGFILLIDFIEEEFAIKANDEDLIEENFESIAAIAGFIQKKQTTLAARHLLT